MQIKQFLIAVCIGTMFAACSSRDDYSIESTKHPLQITVGIKGMQTRSSGNESQLQNTDFLDGEAISVFPDGVHCTMIEGLPENGYVTYTKTPVGWTTDADLYVLGSGDQLEARAVYPAKDASGNQMTWETTSFAVQSNQSTDANYRKSDLMYAFTTNVDPANPIPLEFYHCMSKITVIVEDPSEVYNLADFKVNLSNVEMGNIKTNATISYSNGVKTATGTGSTGWLTVCDTGAADALCSTGVSCIIPPQTVDGGTQIIGVRVDVDNVYWYSVPSGGVEFKGGYEYIYKLTLKKAGFSLSEITIKSWQSGTENPVEGEAR